jgi:hypothetical protein
MNAACDLLDDLAMIGATIEPAGDRLILRAGPTAIPAALVNRVREAKADHSDVDALHASVVAAGYPAALGRRDQRRNQRPFVIPSGHSGNAVGCGRNACGSPSSTSVTLPRIRPPLLNQKRFIRFNMFTDRHSGLHHC